MATAEGPAPIPVQTVFQCLEHTLSVDAAIRSAAEAQLREWEGDAAPGFIGSLLKVVAEVQAVPEEGRLMAAVVAKNAVGSSWRKTLGSREWSRVPEDEKQYIRSTAMACLLGDPSDRVALQITLLITNIARFDVPQPWGSLLPDLIAAAAEESPVAAGAKQRALTALKHVLQALRGKKFVITTNRDARLLTEEEFEQLAAGVQHQRQQLDQQCKALLAPLRQQWEQHTAALLQGGEGWQRRGRAAAAALSACRELMHVLQDFEGIEDALTALLSELHQAAAAIAPQLLSGPLAAAAVTTATAAGGEAAAVAAAAGDPHLERWQLLGKNWERLLQVALVTMDRHTFQFAAHLPPMLSLCINAALLAMEASLVHHIRAKARVVLVRFCARALLQQLYRRDFVEGASPEARFISDVGRDAIARYRPQLLSAADALDALLAPAQCPALVQAIVQKYIMLSPDEVAEWEADPESFARNVDVETSPDADTPRPCGVALLECMLERADEPVANALLEMARQQQALPLTSAENILMREGTYRAIGECFLHLRSKVDFNAWYANELRLILQSTELTGLHGSILRAGALWLLGVCGAELQAQHWGEAFGLVVGHVAHSDVVVALMAVSALTVLLSNCLEESQFVSAPPGRKRLILEGPHGAQQLLGSDSEEEAAGDLAAAVDAEFAVHMRAVEGSTDAIIAGCFALLPRLAEIESMVRVLQCVSSAVELLGDRVRPHLHTICSALPQVWQLISQRQQEGAGGLARLHSALISTVTHLLMRLGSAAVADPRVAELLFPLLQHATNLGSADAEPLVEDGLRLWSAVLSTSEQLLQPLQELFVQRLPPILRRGQDTTACLKIAEGHALLGGLPAATALLGPLAEAITKSLGAAVQAAAAHQMSLSAMLGTVMGPGQAHHGQKQQQPKGLTADQAAESTAAASLLTLLIQLGDQAAAAALAASGQQQPPEVQLPAELQPAAKVAAAVAAADFGGGVVRLPSQGVALVESCLEAVGRLLFKQPGLLPALLDGNSEAEARLLDRWVLLAGVRDVVEMFMPAMGSLGRVRRHRAAVTLCSLLYADALPLLRTPERAAQALALGIRAAREQEQFARDQQRLAEAQITDPTHSDQLVLRRLALAREDPLKAIDAREAARAAATKVASWLGDGGLKAQLQHIDPLLSEQLELLLRGEPLANAMAAVNLNGGGGGAGGSAGGGGGGGGGAQGGGMEAEAPSGP